MPRRRGWPGWCRCCSRSPGCTSAGTARSAYRRYWRRSARSRAQGGHRAGGQDPGQAKAKMVFSSAYFYRSTPLDAAHRTSWLQLTWLHASCLRTFIGVDLGGGKGKTTAVARLRLAPAGAAPGVVVDDYGGDRPWYDERLIEYLRQHAEDAVVAIDAPLTLPACAGARCPPARGMRPARCPRCALAARAQGRRRPGRQARYTPYTQRATEVLLHEDHGIVPRETLGPGDGTVDGAGGVPAQALAGATAQRGPAGGVPEGDPGAAVPRPGGAAGGAGDGPGPHRMRGLPGRQRPERPRTAGAGARQVARHYKRSGHAGHCAGDDLHGLRALSLGRASGASSCSRTITCSTR